MSPFINTYSIITQNWIIYETNSADKFNAAQEIHNLLFKIVLASHG